MNQQQLVRNFNENSGMCCKPEYRLLDLVSEIGELSKDMLNHSKYGMEKVDLNPAFYREEMGDIYYSFLSLANELNIDLSTELNNTLDKYKKRIRESGNPSSSKREG